MAGPIRVSAVFDGAQASRGLGSLGDKARSVGAGIAKAGAIAAVGFAALGAGAYQAVQSASDLSEEISKSGVIFGKQADSIRAFSEKAATALGQSQVAALDAASTFGQIGQKAGLSGRESAKFAKQFTTLASDLASFNNTSPEEAIEAIGSAMRGEAEPIRKYGVMLDDATLRNQALKLGLVDSIKTALTPQQKALAASAAIMAQTSKAQGDFARTSDGAANKQRIIAAQVENLKAKIGEGLLPVYAKLLDGVSRFIEFMSSRGVPVITAVAAQLRDALAPAVEFARDVLEKIAAVIFSNLGPAMGTAGGIAATLGEAFSTVAGLIKTTLLAAFEALQPAILGGIETLKLIGATIAANIGPAVTAVVPVLQSLAATFTGSVLPAFTTFAVFVQQQVVPVILEIATVLVQSVLPVVARFATFIVGTLVPAVVDIATRIGSKLAPIVTQLGETIRGSVIPAVQKIAAKFEEWRPTIQKVIEVVVKVIGKVLEFAAAILGKVLPPLIRFAGFMLSNVVPAVLGVIDVVVKIIAKAIAFGGAVVDAVQDVAKFVRGVKDKFGEALAFVKSIPGKVTKAFGDAGQILLQVGRDIVNGLINGIKDAAGLVADAVAALVDKIPGPIKKLMGIASPSRVMFKIGTQISDGLAKGIASGLEDVEAAMERATKLITRTINKRIKNDKRAARVIKERIADLRDEYAALRRNATAQERLAEKIDKAREKYRAAVRAAKEYAASIKESFVTFGSIVGLGQGEDGTVTATGLLNELADKMKRAFRFAELIKRLTGRLNPTSLQQLIDAGVEGGLATAEAIAAGGSAVIDSVNLMTKQIAEVGGGLGSRLAKEFHQAGIDEAAGFVQELRNRARELARVGEGLADAFLDAVKAGLAGKPTTAPKSALSGGFGAPALAVVGAAGAGRVPESMTRQQAERMIGLLGDLVGVTADAPAGFAAELNRTGGRSARHSASRR